MKRLNMLLLIVIGVVALSLQSCDEFTKKAPVSSGGVEKASTTIQTDANGHTTEQNNIIARYKMDNTPGSIKHLYIISAYSGQVLVYSTVKGKVTSSGKRLSPPSVVHYSYQSSGEYNPELIQDDGTYGSSVDYIYWWDTKGVYHQQYIQGGMMLHISDQPLAVKNIVLNMELTNVNDEK
jgi:hypothetical protein